MSKDTTIQIRVSHELKAKLMKMAENDRRILSDFIRIKLQDIAGVQS